MLRLAWVSTGLMGCIKLPLAIPLSLGIVEEVYSCFAACLFLGDYWAWRLLAGSYGFVLPASQIIPNCEETKDALIAMVAEARRLDVL